MAERRMFAKTIIDSDAFLDMPTSARLLYYDLGMRADDDGFVNSPKKIMRMTGASDDDLKVLITKKFIIPFESGIVVIKHWRIHNYIRKDTYNQTPYIEEKNMLTLDENKAYTLKKDDCQQFVDESSTQVRLGKVSIDKVNIYSENEKPKKIKEEKIHFAEFVSMTNAEYEKLISTYGKNFADQCIATLDNYKGSKGKTYKDDYRAILNWVVKRVKEDGFKPKPNEKNQAEQKEISYSCDIFTDQEYAQIMKGKMSKEEQLRIVKERTGEGNV